MTSMSLLAGKTVFVVVIVRSIACVSVFCCLFVLFHFDSLQLLQLFCNHSIKRKHGKLVALNTWKLNILNLLIKKFQTGP